MQRSYNYGLDILGADGGVAAARARDWDNSQTYEVGEVVNYWGKYWRAQRRVTPPWSTWLSSGDVPGSSDAWVELSAREIVQNVLGDAVTVIPQVGATYTDYYTVLAVQKALKKAGFDPGTLDGKMGPNTAKAIRAMQISAGDNPTGVIDASVLSALRVSAPRSGGAASVSAQAALDAATTTEHAKTPEEVMSAAQQVQTMMAMAGMPPAVQEAATKASAQAKAAKTPEEVKKAKEQVQAVIEMTQPTGFWSQPLWQDAPVNRWQGALVGVGGVAIGVGVLSLLLGGKRRRR